MKNQSGSVLSLSPELWVGLAVGFDKPFSDAFKAMVSVVAWDPMSRTRWFPISYMPHVKQLVREHKMSSDMALDRANEQIQAELNRRTRLKAATDVDGQVNAALTDDYAKLGLHPSAPRWLVEWAIIGARKEAESLGAPTTKLLEQEEAYRRLCAPAGDTA